MRKALIYAVFVAVSVTFLSSFTLKTTIYKTTCKDGSVYYFECPCGLTSAQGIGNLICNMPVSE